MASVRASVMTQAQAAARRLGAVPEDPASAPCVEQLVRCAQLSQDAEHTLDWPPATAPRWAAPPAKTGVISMA